MMSNHPRMEGFDSSDHSMALALKKIRRFRFITERHSQFALGIAICRQDVHVAIGPFVVGFEWPLEWAEDQ